MARYVLQGLNKLDVKTAETIFSKLEAQGFSVLSRLNAKELADIESFFNIQIPPDFRLFLSVGVLTDNDKNDFPNWHGDIPKIYAKYEKHIVSTFCFDIEENGYWHESFGEKPMNINLAKTKAINIVHLWPPIIPICGRASFLKLACCPKMFGAASI